MTDGYSIFNEKTLKSNDVDACEPKNLIGQSGQTISSLQSKFEKIVSLSGVESDVSFGSQYEFENPEFIGYKSFFETFSLLSEFEKEYVEWVNSPQIRCEILLAYSPNLTLRNKSSVNKRWGYKQKRIAIFGNRPPYSSDSTIESGNPKKDIEILKIAMEELQPLYAESAIATLAKDVDRSLLTEDQNRRFDIGLKNLKRAELKGINEHKARNELKTESNEQGLIEKLSTKKVNRAKEQIIKKSYVKSNSVICSSEGALDSQAALLASGYNKLAKNCLMTNRDVPVILKDISMFSGVCELRVVENNVIVWAFCESFVR